ncbi:MAG: D-alanyl-D-alanine carboxypeptidase [Butyrivibrio sp.]|nr:D-alanyl-D-alanine carboxypeptidase [Butyrivibrio sp.]
MNFSADINHKNRIRHLAASISLLLAASFLSELPIEARQVQDWPEGPSISAEAAIVMDANTKTILYSKNIDEKLYPASTTKIMTCLLAVENAKLDEQVVFSHDAVFSVPRDGSNLGIDEGESISLEEALFGIMVGSANEVANAVAEHVGGSIDKFVDMMNARAKELGCKNTHFSNTNGIQADDHYTSAYDLALIAREFFSNDLLCKVGNTPNYHFTATETQPDEFPVHNKHKLINGEIKYDGIVGGKTGYTDLARETLVTCAERDGMRLICVVLKDESPEQFNDTVTLFNYGFNNFRAEKVADVDKRYMPDDSLFFESDNDVFGKSGTILNLNPNDYIVLPVNASIDDTEYEISYDITPEEKSKTSNALAKVIYKYNGTTIGSALVCYFEQEGTPSQLANAYHSIFINVKILIMCAGVFVVLMTLVASVATRIAANRTFHSRSDRIRYNRRKREFNKGHIRFRK